MAEHKRPTVIVNCSVPNGVQLRRSGPAVFDPSVPEQIITLRGGQNSGIDKEWFDGWLDENKNLSLVTEGLITAVDEDPANAGQPVSAQRKEATMDHDVMHRDVQGLKKFRAEAEEAIAFYKGIKAAGGVLPAAPTGPDPAFQDLKSHVDSLADAVTRLQQAQEQTNFASKSPDGIEQRLAALEISKAEAAAFSDQLGEMLAWFTANREALEVLLSLDGEPDASSGGANTGDTAASGATAEKPGADPAAAPDQAPAAAPQGDQAAGSTV